MIPTVLLVAPSDAARTTLVEAFRRSGVEVVAHPPASGPDVIVHVVRPDGPGGPAPVEELDTADWIRRVHDPLWALVETLRTARTGSAPVVVVVESTGLSGAPDTTAASAAAEGARAIAKSAARVFGGDGPPVQMVAVDPIVLGSEDVIGTTIRPRNRPAPTVDDLVEAIHAARRLPAGIGGGLLVVDGGRTMLP